MEMEKTKEDSGNIPNEEQIELVNSPAKDDGEKIVSPQKETRDTVDMDNTDSPPRDTMLSFVHTKKLKADSMLQANSWVYNELMSLKKKVDNIQQNQDLDKVKLSQMELQVENIPKLNDYEQKLRLFIKESG